MLENNGLAINRLNALGAALNLSFIGSEELNSRVTFTRASGATRFNKNGLLEVMGNDVPRFDYDPAGILGGNGVELLPSRASGFTSLVGTSVNSGGIASLLDSAIVVTQGSAGQFGQAIVSYSGLTAGRTYRVVINLKALNSNSIVVFQMDGGRSLSNPTVPGIYTYNITVNNNSSNFVLAHFNSANIGSTLQVASISIQEIICAPKGLLIEESRTNLFLHSENQTQAVWAKTDITAAKTQIGLSGSANSACLITEGSAGNSGLSQGSGAIAAGSTSTYTAVLRKGSGNDWIQIGFASPGGNGYQGWFNINTGALGTTGVLGTGTGSASITNLGNGYYACCVTATIGGADTACNSNLYSTTANAVTTRVAGATYTISHAQVEQGAFPTSYIPTTTAAVTRAADNAVMTGTNFSSWYNQTQGTFVVSSVWDSPPDPTAPQLLLQIDNATSAERTYLRRNTGGVSNFDSVVASVFQGLINPTPNTITTGVVVKSGIAYSAAATTTALNASALGVSGAKPLPTVTQMTLGSALASVYLNGHISSIQYYNTKLSDAKLQALTT